MAGQRCGVAGVHRATAGRGRSEGPTYHRPPPVTAPHLNNRFHSTLMGMVVLMVMAIEVIMMVMVVPTIHSDYPFNLLTVFSASGIQAATKTLEDTAGQ